MGTPDRLIEDKAVLVTGKAPLSVACIIPTWQEAERIASTVRTVQREPFSEITVVDAGSPDGTARLARATADGDTRIKVISSDKGRGTQMATGLAASRPADAVLLLHADTRLPPNPVALIRATLADPRTVAGCFRLTFDRRSLMLDLSAAATNWDTAWTTFGDQAFFARTAALKAAGGIPETPFMEDVILRRRLRRIGRFMKRPERVISSARRFDRFGIVRTQSLNAVLLMGFHIGVPISILARTYGIRVPHAPEASASEKAARSPRQTLHDP